MLRILCAVFIFLIAGSHAFAAEDLLAIDLAENHVDITTGFNGAKLVLFGVQEEEGDIAIVFSGPEHPVIVRKKDQFNGAWINSQSMSFARVPVYYDYALENPEAEQGKQGKSGLLAKEGIGLEALRFKPVLERAKPEEIKVFQDALIRNRQAQGLFAEKPAAITFLNDHFFRATFHLPPNVPTGKYRIATYLLRGSRVLGVKTMDVNVAQVGTSANIYRFAHTKSLAYGLVCVIFAMFAGWFSNVLGRRH